MAVVTIAQVLEHAEEFERMLAHFYARLSERMVGEGVRLLTDYMSRHRDRITAAFEKLPADRVERILATPLHYEPQAADCRCFDGVDLPDDATAGEVLDAAITFDECLVSLYRQASRQPMDDEAREFFESLIRAEQRDEIELKKIKAMDYF